MRTGLRRWTLAGALLGFGLPAGAADFGGMTGAGCAGGIGSSLSLAAEDSELSRDVVRLMDEAVVVSHDARWVHSTRPVFLWANEAKVACGKAHGYLRYSVRDDQALSNCGCFHARMISHMD